MSIIHDALKKVQQGLAPKTADEKPVNNYIYANSAPTVPAEDPPMKTDPPKSSGPKKINALLALLFAVVITAVCSSFILQQFQKDIPKVKRWLTASYLRLHHKKLLPDFKTRTPDELKPLAHLTIAPPAVSNTSQPPAALVLNIHGIMVNGSSNLALINDQVYQEGDEVEGAKIVKINLDSITLINNGKEETIHIGK